MKRRRLHCYQIPAYWPLVLWVAEPRAVPWWRRLLGRWWSA